MNTLAKLEPLNSVSTGYAIMKYHKPEKDIRPIITHYNSIIAHILTYIKNLMQPIAKECEFAIDSPKKFKERFSLDSLKFDPENIR
jgi:hypothetical protein